jgi:hypothetical protein
MNTKRVLRWLIFNSIVWAVALYALVWSDDVGAQRVLKAYIVISTATALMIAFNSEARAKLRTRGPSVPRWLNASVDMMFVFYLSYFGWWWFMALAFVKSCAEVAIYKET